MTDIAIVAYQQSDCVANAGAVNEVELIMPEQTKSTSWALVSPACSKVRPSTGMCRSMASSTVLPCGHTRPCWIGFER